MHFWWQSIRVSLQSRSWIVKINIFRTFKMFKISSYNNRFQLFSSLHPHPMHPSVGSPRRGSLHSLNTHRPDSGGRNGARSRWKTLAKTLRYHPFVTSAHVWTFSNPPTHLPTYPQCQHKYSIGYPTLCKSKVWIGMKVLQANSINLGIRKLWWIFPIQQKFDI